jgi:hypothetical protein
MACKILQKQIEHIDGKKENIIVPSIAMAQIRDRERAGICVVFRMIYYIYCIVLRTCSSGS